MKSNCFVATIESQGFQSKHKTRGIGADVLFSLNLRIAEVSVPNGGYRPIALPYIGLGAVC